MLRFMLMLTVTAAPAAPLLSRSVAKAHVAAPRCCCCLIGECHCGCEAPDRSTRSGEGPDQNSPSICVCDELPLGLPAAASADMKRLVSMQTLPVPVDAGPVNTRHSELPELWPHAPPPDRAILATVIILS